MTRRWATTTTTTVFFLAVRLFVLVHSQHKDRESLCESQETCRRCLQTPQCAWCSTAGESAPLLRCVSKETLLKEDHFWCSKSDIIYYENSMTVVENRSLSSIKDREVVQPQKIYLRLRRGEEHRVTMKYRQVEDYPVDLYYLLDLSWTMLPYRQKLSELSQQLVRAMRNLTSNFRIGFGSFIDKVIIPMTNTLPEKLESPCKDTYGRKPCAPPYNYINQLSLTDSEMDFKSKVQNAPTSTNMDDSEGGLEAMMQVMVCDKKIGWRSKARHLIVFSSDALPHIAGDGKVAGLVKPNDCKCHLDDNGVYNYLEHDYPSISQISRKAREHNMNIIFAVPDEIKAIYSNITHHISGSSIGILQGNSENVIDLVSGEYEKLVDTMTLVDTVPKMIDIKYYSRCLNKTGDLLERRECGGLRVDNDIEFEIVLKVTECPADPKDWKQTVHIKPRELNESLTIDVEIMCDCPCERPEDPGYRPNAAECKGNGTSVCGMCFCNPDFYGKQCECKVNEVGGNATTDCKLNNQTDEICSGRGKCTCGMCECEKRPNHPKELFYGKYCQCDNFSCQRSGGKLCNGKGTCDCGICKCDSGWGGEKCDCKMNNSTCIPPSGGNVEICSGRGECICGSCHCQERNNIRYSGEYCEECPICPGQRCEELKDCVECTAYKTGRLAKEGKCSLCSYDIDTVKVVKEDSSDKKTSVHMCRIPSDEGCTFVFKYQYHNNRSNSKIYKIHAQEKRICPAPINVLGVALGVVISTVVIGFLILLIWKILTMIHDKREYAKFEKERALAKWSKNKNPLYKPATSTFSNLKYKKAVNE